jgi:hypothetical protein
LGLQDLNQCRATTPVFVRFLILGCGGESGEILFDQRLMSFAIAMHQVALKQRKVKVTLMLFMH